MHDAHNISVDDENYADTRPNCDKKDAVPVGRIGELCRG
jgi:hypothetical protein